MLKVNLEKELIRSNKVIHTPKELLILREYETLTKSEADVSVFERVGIASVVSKGSMIARNSQQASESLRKYDPSRVFHISQIKDICLKYRLRFLNAKMFAGNIDPALAGKITTFEVAYGDRVDRGSAFIMAPASSFNLEEKPKDPLFFHHLGGGFYYLIHKWGNDLSIFRRVLGMGSNAWFTYFVISLCLLIPTAFFFYVADSPMLKKGVAEIYFTIACTISVFWAIFSVFSIVRAANDEHIRFSDPSVWDSSYV